MTTCRDIDVESSSTLSRIVTILLFLLAQVVAALLIGSVALALSSTSSKATGLASDAALTAPSAVSIDASGIDRDFNHATVIEAGS